MNTTTLSQISPTISGFSTLNSALATKANASDVYDTLWIDETLDVINSKNNSQDITLSNHTTSIGNLTTRIDFVYNNSLSYADSRANAVFLYADTIQNKRDEFNNNHK